MNKIFITGPPRVGKTTIIVKLIEELKKNKRVKIGGFYCPEVRVGEKRIGFKIVDISSGKDVWLAKEEEGFPKVGKYHILIDEVKNIIDEIFVSIQNSELIIIDEIGPMELKINELKNIIDFSINSSKPLIAVLHRSLVEKFRKYKVIYVTYENRKNITSTLLHELENIIK
ncbi:MAG: NTPase [Sulfolobaceae archaeon]